MKLAPLSFQNQVPLNFLDLQMSHLCVQQLNFKEKERLALCATYLFFVAII